ncbi:MAG: GNAT family N-acetyltransferase [Chloroflexi bacterium]|nr:MAG: GNAT family N-acetyltransferase [Chloroflexota bacterium]
MISIRPANPDDLSEIYHLDHVARHDEARRAFIARATKAGECFVAQWDDIVAGYAILNYSFFENGFISLLYVHEAYRRQGVGTALMQYLASVCVTPKLFTSTNLSNLPMQSLLAKLGYTLSGVIHNLDEGDPELVFVKFLCDEGRME